MARMFEVKPGSNIWRIVVDTGINPSTGQRRRKTETIEGKKKAEARIKELEGKVVTGEYFEASKQLLEEYLIRWIDFIAKPNLKPITYEGYRRYITKHINPVIGKIPLNQLTPLHVQEFYSYKSEFGSLKYKDKDGTPIPGPLSSRSVVYMHSILRQALENAVDMELIPKNPCAKAKPPRSQKRPGQNIKGEPYVVLDAGQLDTFLKKCESHRDHAIIYTAAYTGMRQAELLGLQWADILWAENAVRVERTLSLLPEGGYDLNTTKTQTSTRTVKVHESVMAVLKEHRKGQLERQLKQEGFKNEKGFVFPDWKSGKEENRQNLQHRYRNLVTKHGHEGMRFHDLRHTHATILLSAGEYINAVSERLGHASVDITLKVYGHVLPNRHDKVAKRFADLLAGRE